jgi:hypothetical protein
MAQFGVTTAAANPANPATPAATIPTAAPAAAAPSTSTDAPVGFTPLRPDLPESIAQRFFPISSPAAAPLPLVFTPAILTDLSATFSDKSSGVSVSLPYRFLIPITPDATALPQGPGEALDDPALTPATNPPADPSAWGLVPPFARKPAAFTAARDAAIDHVYNNCTLDLLACPALGEISSPGESEGDFRARLQHAAREKRDLKLADIERKWGPKIRAAEDARARAAAAYDRERSQANSARIGTAVNIGQAILGALFGRKSTSTLVTKSAQVARGASRAWNQGDDVSRAVEKVEAVETDAARLQEELASELALARQFFDVSAIPLEKKSISPLKKNIAPLASALAWLPAYDSGNGRLESAWQD